MDPKLHLVSAPKAEAPNDEELGKQVREARLHKGLTLEEVSRLAGVGRSTLSKIENNQTSPSFEIVRRLTKALDLNMPQLFLQSSTKSIAGRRDVTRKGQGELNATPTYRHELLCTELLSKRMLPYISTITARDIDDFEDWIRHKGEEFMYVLGGSVELHTEHYRPVALESGDSIYYDSGMGHCCISTSEEDARVLWISLE